MNKQLNIGLFGYGCVGSGLVEVLKQTPGIQAAITQICVKDKDKKRNLPPSFFTYNKNDLLYNDNINVIVELIDDANEAFTIVSTALRNGKAVVTANKKMLAENFEELYQLQQQYQVPLLYEGSAGGAIPIIRSLEEYYDNDTLSSIEGILNGTTNFILTKTIQENKSYEEALKDAQELGFAESDPKLDVEAFDPKYKLVILIAHAFGIIVDPKDILNYGIKYLGKQDVQYAKEKGYAIKLVAQAAKSNQGIKALVLPRFVKNDDTFFHVSNEFNAVQVAAAFSDKQLLKGKGAGSYPTAAAVLSDLSALRYQYKYEYKKLQRPSAPVLEHDGLVRVYLRYQDADIFSQLQFETIDEAFNSSDYKYVIGEVRIKQLLEANLNERDDLFLAEVIKSTEPIIRKSYRSQQLASIH